MSTQRTVKLELTKLRTIGGLGRRLEAKSKWNRKYDHL